MLDQIPDIKTAKEQGQMLFLQLAPKGTSPEIIL